MELTIFGNFQELLIQDHFTSLKAANLFNILLHFLKARFLYCINFQFKQTLQIFSNFVLRYKIHHLLQSLNNFVIMNFRIIKSLISVQSFKSFSKAFSSS